MKRIVQITERLVAELRAAKMEDTEWISNQSFTPHCLIIEDDANDAQLSRMALESVGADVRVATTGDEAIQILEHSENPLVPDFHIVFLDLVLRGSAAQGIHVLKYIRERFSKLHVVIVSGHVDQGILNYLSKIKEGGYIGIITKPLHRSNVTEILYKHRLSPVMA